MNVRNRPISQRSIDLSARPLNKYVLNVLKSTTLRDSSVDSLRAKIEKVESPTHHSQAPANSRGLAGAAREAGCRANTLDEARLAEEPSDWRGHARAFGFVARGTLRQGSLPACATRLKEDRELLLQFLRTKAYDEPAALACFVNFCAFEQHHGWFSRCVHRSVRLCGLLLTLASCRPSAGFDHGVYSVGGRARTGSRLVRMHVGNIKVDAPDTRCAESFVVSCQSCPAWCCQRHCPSSSLLKAKHCTQLDRQQSTTGGGLCWKKISAKKIFGKKYPLNPSMNINKLKKIIKW